MTVGVLIVSNCVRIPCTVGTVVLTFYTEITFTALPQEIRLRQLLGQANAINFLTDGHFP